MDVILYFFRDKIVGTHYFIYAFVCLFLMFSIIGYLFKQKYGKLEIILNTSQVKIGKIKEIEPKKTRKEKNKKGKVPTQIVQTTKQQVPPPIVNQNVASQSNPTNQSVVNQLVSVGITNQGEIQEVITPERKEPVSEGVLQQPTKTLTPQSQVGQSNQVVSNGKIPEIE